MAVELLLRSLGEPAVTCVAVPFHCERGDGIRARDPERTRTAMARRLAVATRRYRDDRSIERMAQRELARLRAPGLTRDDLLTATAASDGRGDGRAQRESTRFD